MMKKQIADVSSGKIHSLQDQELYECQNLSLKPDWYTFWLKKLPITNLFLQNS
jgi:hypothetical protein